MDVQQLFCKNIVFLKEKHLPSEKEMAHRLGISVGRMKKIEKGVIPKRMSARIIFRVCHCFGVHPGELFLSREEDELHFFANLRADD